MKAWERARLERRCGFCGRVIAIGQPLLAQWIAGHSWRKIRCAECAGEPVPENLPLLDARPSMPMTPIGSLTPVGRIARDWKTAAVGREPGEDDA